MPSSIAPVSGRARWLAARQRAIDDAASSTHKNVPLRYSVVEGRVGPKTGYQNPRTESKYRNRRHRPFVGLSASEHAGHRSRRRASREAALVANSGVCVDPRRTPESVTTNGFDLPRDRSAHSGLARSIRCAVLGGSARRVSRSVLARPRST